MLHQLGTLARELLSSAFRVGKLPLKSITVTYDFKRGNFTKMRRIVKRKLKGKPKRVTSLEDHWKLFKITLIEAQIEYIPRVRKGTGKFRRRPA